MGASYISVAVFSEIRLRDLGNDKRLVSRRAPATRAVITAVCRGKCGA